MASIKISLQKASIYLHCCKNDEGCHKNSHVDMTRIGVKRKGF